MDEACAKLREKHLAALQRQESRDMYDRTAALCEERTGGLQPSDLDMIADLCQYEDIKQELMADVRSRGVMVESRNGRQTYRKENPALARISRYAELQRKIRADLRITPDKRLRGAGPEEDAEDEDDFDRF